MQNLDISPPAIAPQAPPENPTWWPGPASPQKPDERFDSVMGRTLARNSSDSADDSDAAGKVAVDKRKPQRSRPASADSPSPKLAAENAAAQSSPAPNPPAAPPSSPSTQSNPGASVDAVSPGTDNADAAPASGLSPIAASIDTAAALSGKIALSPSAPGPVSRALSEAAGPVRNLVGELEEAGAAKTVAPKNADVIPATTAGTAPQAATNGTATTEEKGNLDAPADAVPAGFQVSGISSAQQQLAMDKADKTKEISASAEQNLPAAVAGLTGEELPGRSARPADSASASAKPASDSASNPSLSNFSSPSDPAVSAVRTAALASETPVRSLERAHDLMSLHAFRLRDSGADSLQVVIKPGPNLQLSLHLQMRDGTVDMQATLHRGDYELLNKHWTDLQESLESRGVRLAPLSCGDQGASGQNPFSQPGSAGKDGEPAQPGTLHEISIATALKPAPQNKTAQAPRGWESWA